MPGTVNRGDCFSRKCQRFRTRDGWCLPTRPEPVRVPAPVELGEQTPVIVQRHRGSVLPAEIPGFRVPTLGPQVVGEPNTAIFIFPLNQLSNKRPLSPAVICRSVIKKLIWLPGPNLIYDVTLTGFPRGWVREGYWPAGWMSEELCQFSVSVSALYIVRLFGRCVGATGPLGAWCH